MHVEQVMTRDAVAVAKQASVGDAWALMRERGFRHLPVVEGQRLVGIVSDRDLCLAMAHAVGARLLVDAWLWGTPFAGGLPASDPRLRAEMLPEVGAVMRRAVVTVGPATPVGEAGRLLLKRKIGALPVVEDGRLVGIVTESDLFRTLIGLLGARDRAPVASLPA